MARGELKELKECHKKFKQDYCNLIESLSRVNNLAITRNRQWRENKEELVAAQAEIARLCGQLSQAPTI